MFIPQVGDFVSIRKGGRSNQPFDIVGTVSIVTYTAYEDQKLLMITFENNLMPMMVSEADEIQVH